MKKNNFQIEKSGITKLNLDNLTDIAVDVKENIQAEIYLSESRNKEIKINLFPNATLKLINFSKSRETKITVDIWQNAELEMLVFVNSQENNYESVIINLNQDSAKALLSCFALNESSETQEYAFTINHNNINTTGIMRNYFLASKGKIKGCFKNVLTEKSLNSLADQQTKGIIMTDASEINATPELFVDCFDVKASHGLSIGKISDDILFYAMSRGLKETECLKMIVNGFLSPMLEKISDAKIKKELIEEFS